MQFQARSRRSSHSWLSSVMCLCLWQLHTLLFRGYQDQRCTPLSSRCRKIQRHKMDRLRQYQSCSKILFILPKNPRIPIVLCRFFHFFLTSFFFFLLMNCLTKKRKNQSSVVPLSVEDQSEMRIIYAGGKKDLWKHMRCPQFSRGTSMTRVREQS